MLLIGVGHYQTVQLVTRRDAGTQSTNSTPREAGSDEHCPCERPDLVGPLSSTERVRDDGAPEMEETQSAKNSMNKPHTPNSDPLPNPWASTDSKSQFIYYFFLLFFSFLLFFFLNLIFNG